MDLLAYLHLYTTLDIRCTE